MQKRTLDLGPNRRLVTITAAVVVGLHLALLVLWMADWSIEDMPKRPDIDIELSAPPPVATASQAPIAPPAPEPAAAAPAPAAAPLPEAPKPPADAATVAAPTAPAAPEATPAPADTGSASDVLPSAMTSDADYKAPELNNPKPLYPLTAVRQEAQGRVLLLVEVTADGRAGRITLEKSSGHAILDASAMNTVRLWQFIPARKDGVFQTQTIRVPIDFKLNESR